MSRQPLTIGRLARASGVNVETVRYYQRIGLLEEPPRPVGGFRRYSADAVDRIAFIKRAQRLGFRLGEVRELLELGDGRCADVRARAEEKRSHVHARIRELKALRATLDDLIKDCRSGRGDGPCPIVEALARPARERP